ncbi:MAG: Do family serine endopeptidase [Candidatus Omnitrophica bacterium]|nr:Do family serine endopeptidase [Candidatus Omnitrophota bacterium]
MRKEKLFIFLVLLGVFIGLLIATRFDWTLRTTAQDSQTSAAGSKFLKNLNPYESIHDLEKSTIKVAQNVGKAVVSISTEKTEKIKGPRVRRYQFGFPFGQESPFEDDFFDRFFDDFFGGFEREYKQRGLGSGVIIDKEGYILTNEHVVGDADKLTVTLSDGREFKAQIKGTDSRSDLAIIKINAKNLPAVELGDSDEVKIGQWVLAIGNPFAFALENPEPTVTMGVISALHRSLNRGIGRDRDYSDLIQTDAAINPGNSGGPLVNLSGQIIGINVAIFSTSGGYQGVGFAIPINTARQIVSRLIAGEKILYGWLGVNIQNLDESLVKYFGLKSKDGVLVAKVLSNSPAEKAGVKEGDIITKFNERSVKNINDLMKVVAGTKVGKVVKVVVIRDSKYITLQVKTGQRPESTTEESFVYESETAWRGIEVQSLDNNIARKYRIREKKGVIVVKVEPNSQADDTGIISGDVILEINRESIEDMSDYNRITSKIKGDALVKISRGYFVVKEKIEH